MLLFFLLLSFEQALPWKNTKDWERHWGWHWWRLQTSADFSLSGKLKNFSECIYMVEISVLLNWKVKATCPQFSMTSHDKMSTWLSWCIYEEGGTFISLYHKQRCDSLLDICYLHLMKKRGVIYTDKLVINQFAFHQGIHVCYPLDLKKETYFSFLSVGFPSVTFFFFFFF